VSATDPHQALHRTIEAVWRMESARVIAGLTRLTRDVGLAEDLAQEALVAALEQWPQSGIPDNPAAWLTATAKRRAIDLFRRNAVAERKHQELGRDLATLEQTVPDLTSNLDDPIGDDLLRLVFISCHPILSTRRTDPAPAWRPYHPGDRPRLPHSRTDHRSAHRPRQTHPR